MKTRRNDEREREFPADASIGCVGYRVRRLSRVVSAIYDEAFAPLKLKISQFGILAMLSHRGPQTATDICRLVVMDKSTASRNLQRMRQRGWLAVVEGNAGSGQKISLTRDGVRVLQAAYPLWHKAQREAIRRLGDDGLKALQIVAIRMDND